MQEVIKQTIIDVLAEKIIDLEFEIKTKDEIIEDLEEQVISLQGKVQC